MKVLAIGGEPGCGKTTLMKRIMKEYGIETLYQNVKLVPFHRKDNLVVMGKYEEGEVFGGTDKMSMAVQPHAVDFLDTIMSKEHPSVTVMFEGDRLFNTSFLEHCNEHHNLLVLYLRTNQLIRQARYKERGSNQNETWLRGRETKVGNIISNMLLPTETFHNNVITDHEPILKRIQQFIEEK